MDCLFCKIAAKEIPASIAFENERVVAFADINPQAPTHLQIIPREHIPSSLEVTEINRDCIGELVEVAGHLARELGLADAGYRLGVGFRRVVHSDHAALLRRCAGDCMPRLRWGRSSL